MGAAVLVKLLRAFPVRMHDMCGCMQVRTQSSWPHPACLLTLIIYVCL